MSARPYGTPPPGWSWVEGNRGSILYYSRRRFYDLYPRTFLRLFRPAVWSDLAVRTWWLKADSMAQYVFPTSQLSRIPEILSDSGTVVVRPMDAEPVTAGGNRWHRLTCTDRKARAAACVGEHDARPGVIIVTVSLDLRRLPLLWRIPGDVRLVRRLNQLLERERGRMLAEDK